MINKKISFINYLILFLLVYTYNNQSIFAQSRNFRTEIELLNDDYKQDLINHNLGNWINFLSNTINADSIYEKKQIIKFTSNKIKILDYISTPFRIITDCDSPRVGATVFFIRYEGQLEKEEAEGNVISSKAPIAYKWKKISNNTLFFVYIEYTIDPKINNYIYIPEVNQ